MNMGLGCRRRDTHGCLDFQECRLNEKVTYGIDQAGPPLQVGANGSLSKLNGHLTVPERGGLK
jgi:hypothetical protein